MVRDECVMQPAVRRWFRSVRN